MQPRQAHRWRADVRRKIGDRGRREPAQWARFVDREITPRFPTGSRCFNTRGQWRDNERKIVREPSKLVHIVLPGKPRRNPPPARSLPYKAASASIGRIVLRAACVAF